MSPTREQLDEALAHAEELARNYNERDRMHNPELCLAAAYLEVVAKLKSRFGKTRDDFLRWVAGKPDWSRASSSAQDWAWRAGQSSFDREPSPKEVPMAMLIAIKQADLSFGGEAGYYKAREIAARYGYTVKE
jgi:hypothetical protein